MLVFYGVAFLLTCIGVVLWHTCKRIVLWEALTGAGVAFAIAGICHAFAINGMLADQETISGRITEVRHIPAWTEYYEYAVYRTETRTGTRMVTDGKGHSHMKTYTYTVQVFDHWQPATRHHPETWKKGDDFSREWTISQGEYSNLVLLFGKETAVSGVRHTSDHNSKLQSGDANDYLAANMNGWVQPVTMWHAWENRVKAAPSVFSFPPVASTVPVFDYPTNADPFTSDRLLGTASGTITALAWDQMNARLGRAKKVNVIAVGFGPKDSSIAEQQRAKWIGGKKNDLVICYGGPDKLKPAWVHVFGWTDSDICKHKLETILLDNQVNNAIVPLLEATISTDYQIKDWHDFDYLTVEPPTSAYCWFFAIVILVQGGAWVFFFMNEESKVAVA